MPITAKILKCQIDSRLVAGGLSALACCQLTWASNILCGQIVACVSTSSCLPCATFNSGRLIYVADTCQYYLSDGISWITDASSEALCYYPQLYAWGSTNNCGQLGDNTTITRNSPAREISSSTNWCAVSVGTLVSQGLKTDGTLWSWGRSNYGQLGNNSVNPRSSPVQEISCSTNWCQSNAGSVSASAIKTDGSLWSWGNGDGGRLGNNCTSNTSSPVRENSLGTSWCMTSAGNSAGAAIKTDGTLWTWGCNVCGAVGDNTSISRSSPVQEISGSNIWRSVSAGVFTVTALRNDGTIWSWGSNACGVIGDNTSTCRSSPVQESTGSTTWRSVSTSSGSSFSTALKTDGSLYAWGTNVFGQLGDNTTLVRSTPVRDISSGTLWCAVCAGSSHTIALKSDGSLWAWGAGGNTGDGSVTDRCSPVREISSSTTWCTAAAGSTSAAIKMCARGFL